MGEIKHTPGPWRWEFNATSRTVNLVGGNPRFDLTIMDFTRWGMGGAVPRFLEPAEAKHGLNLMSRLCDRADWIAPFENRQHHAKWCAAVTHPDACLMAAAPDLLEALKGVLPYMEASEEAGLVGDEGCHWPVEAVRAAIAKATGAQS